MDNEKAMEIIKELTRGLGENGYVKIANNLAIKALEKQIPRKVTHEGFCPTCKTQYPMHPPSLNKCCGNCGQKLDWD